MVVWLVMKRDAALSESSQKLNSKSFLLQKTDIPRPQRSSSHNRTATDTALPRCINNNSGSTTPRARDVFRKVSYQTFLMVDGGSELGEFECNQDQRATNVSLLPSLTTYAMGDLEGMSEVLHKKARFGRWKQRTLKLVSGPSSFFLVRSKDSMVSYNSLRSWRRSWGQLADEDSFRLSTEQPEQFGDGDKHIDVLDIRTNSIHAYTRLKTAIKLHMKAKSETLVAVHQLWQFQMKTGRTHVFRSSSQRQAMSWCNALRKAIVYSKCGLNQKKLHALSSVVEKRHYQIEKKRNESGSEQFEKRISWGGASIYTEVEEEEDRASSKSFYMKAEQEEGVGHIGKRNNCFTECHLTARP